MTFGAILNMAAYDLFESPAVSDSVGSFVVYIMKRFIM